MDKISLDSRPYLANGVRLFWDNVRQQRFLLVPEGTLVLNATAWAILELCDGKENVYSIITKLSSIHEHPNLEVDVFKLLSKIAERGFLRYQ